MSSILSEGLIAMISNGETEGTDLKPLLQVTDIRAVNTQNQNNSNERYRLLLSDGLHIQQGMLATQHNALVKAQRLIKGSVIRLTQFVCNPIQNRMIIIIIDLDVVHERYDLIGEPKQYLPKADSGTPPLTRPAPGQSFTAQPGTIIGNSQSFGGSSLAGGSVPKPSVGGAHMPPSQMDHGGGSYSYGSSLTTNYNSTNAPSIFAKSESGSTISRSPLNSNVGPRPHLPGYYQPPPMYTNRGPVAKNEAPPRITPIAYLNPYQGRWTIKARVTVKGELRHYNNPRGDGKVFSFDLLDSEGGEIRVTCFNAVADQFYDQIETGKVYWISKGSLKPAQKAFNHLRNDHEIFLDSTSTVQPCLEDDSSIPQQQFHFRPIIEIESMDNNAIFDLIGVVSTVGPSTSIMRKNGTETQKRSLHLKDASGRSVELTLWGNFCNGEGQTIQNICDSGVFPILAVKSCRVSDFNGKAVGTISTSQLFIEPDFPEARTIKAWFDREGKNTPCISISRDTTTISRTDARKTISQIKDEKLGTSEKPDWITVSATISFIKVDNFCYTACPIMIGDRKCSKKVLNNGDGKWRCDRCDQSVDECDYRYILQFQIQDHTGLTWVTAFQEIGEEMIGVSAKDLYFLKYEEQDDVKFLEIVRNILFTKYIFKLKVKEETFSDEQRVKSTVVKAEKVNFSSETRFLVGLMDKLKGGDSSSLAPKAENVFPTTGLNSSGFAPPVVNSMANILENQVSQFGNRYSGSSFAASGPTGAYMSCNSCGGVGHTSVNCPSVMNSQDHSYGGGFGGNRAYPEGGGGGGGGGASGECYKCHKSGHWARDCPGLSNVPPAYGSGSVTPGGRFGNVPRQHVGY